MTTYADSPPTVWCTCGHDRDVHEAEAEGAPCHACDCEVFKEAK